MTGVRHVLCHSCKKVAEGREERIGWRVTIKLPPGWWVDVVATYVGMATTMFNINEPVLCPTCAERRRGKKNLPRCACGALKVLITTEKGLLLSTCPTAECEKARRTLDEMGLSDPEQGAD